MEIWEKSGSVKLAECKEVHLGVLWMKVRAETIVEEERVELVLTSELLSCKGCSIAPGRAPSCLAWDLGPTRSPTRWAARAGKLGSAGIPGMWLEVEPSTRHPRPSGCRSLEAPSVCFALELLSALTQCYEPRGGQAWSPEVL